MQTHNIIKSLEIILYIPSLIDLIYRIYAYLDARNSDLLRNGALVLVSYSIFTGILDSEVILISSAIVWPSFKILFQKPNKS